jgi:hypothetical protein
MTTETKKPSDAPLAVHVVDGRLVIEIGIEVLADAFNHSLYATPYSNKHRDWVPRMRVSDPLEFAKEVALELQNEEEDGATRVTKLLDRACRAAVEDGALGVEDIRPARKAKR